VDPGSIPGISTTGALWFLSLREVMWVIDGQVSAGTSSATLTRREVPAFHSRRKSFAEIQFVDAYKIRYLFARAP
jgi:hypothetical protein